MTRSSEEKDESERFAEALTGESDLGYRIRTLGARKVYADELFKQVMCKPGLLKLLQRGEPK